MNNSLYDISEGKLLVVVAMDANFLSGQMLFVELYEVLDLFAEHRTETASMLENFRCIRTREYKLIQNHNDIFELYDLQNDPREQHNIATEQPDILEAYSGRLRERFFGSRRKSPGMDIKL